MKRLAASLILSTSVLPAATAWADLTADQTPFHSYRGWWADRFDYGGTSTGIVTMMQRAQAMGITDVMVQVRGQADAYYFYNRDASDNIIETWPTGRSYTASTDPLQVAINEGKARGIRVHAWLNMAPLWNGGTRSSDPNHVMNRDPRTIDGVNSDFWIRKSDNTVQPLATGYVTVNPTRDDVQAHINNVVRNIASRYDVDGIHMDYIRLYHNHGGTNPINYPTDPETLGRYTADTGNTFNPATDQTNTTKRAQFKSWLAKEITDLVRSVRQTTKEARPGAQLTAAVWRDADIGYNDYQQDWNSWIGEGLVDAVMPMIYFKNSTTYNTNVTSAIERLGNAGIMPGLGTYLQTDDTGDPTTDFNNAYNNVMNQLNFAKEQGANGFQLFDYGSFYSPASNQVNAQAGARKAVEDFIAANRNAPPAQMIATFETGEDTFTSNITASGSNQNVASGSADRVTSEARSGVGSQQIVINKTSGAASFLARHLSGGGNAGSNTLNPSIGSIGLWLKTTTEDLQIAIAVDENGNSSNTERSYFQNVIADGQWHRYEWFLNDVTHWDAWAGSSNGRVSAKFTLDSIQFLGTAASNVMFLDDVFFDAAAIARNQWTLDSNNGNWTHWGNWTGGAPNAIGATANLLRRGTAPRTININTPITLGTLNIDNNTSYTLSGSGIRMDVASGSAAINVINRGSHTLVSQLTFADPTGIYVDRGATLTVAGRLVSGGASQLTKLGHGTLNLNDGYVQSLAVNGGTVNAQGAGNALEFAGAVTVASGAVLNVNSQLTAGQVSSAGTVNINNSLTIRPNGTLAGISKLTSLNLAPGAKLDLSNNDLLIDYTGASPYAQTRNQVLTGLSTGGATGIVVNYGAANDRILALLDTADGGPTSWNGFAIDSTTIVGKYTFFGDGNLDGKVTGEDYGPIDANLGRSTIKWIEGDYNMDGVISGEDYGYVDGNLGKGTDNPLAYSELKAEMVALHTEIFGEPYLAVLRAVEAGEMVVPEPCASAGLVGLAVAALAYRRQRRKRIGRAA